MLDFIRAFSVFIKMKVKVKSLSCVRLFATPWTAAYQAPPSMGFSRQEYWSGVPLPSPRDTGAGGKVDHENLSSQEWTLVIHTNFIFSGRKASTIASQE